MLPVLSLRSCMALGKAEREKKANTSLRWMGTPEGETTLSFLFLPPFSVGVSVKRKELAFVGTILFLSVDPLWKGSTSEVSKHLWKGWTSEVSKHLWKGSTSEVSKQEITKVVLHGKNGDKIGCTHN